MNIYQKIKKKTRWLIVSATILLGSVVIGVNWIHSDYEKALTIYETHDKTQTPWMQQTLSELNAWRMDYYLKNEALRLLESYRQEKMLYEQLVAELEWMCAISHHPQWFERYQSYALQLKDSKQAFEEATSSAKNNQWDISKAKYEKVIPSDIHYEEAQWQLKQVSRWALDSQLVQVLEAYESKDYDMALTYIESVLAQSPRHPQMLQLKQEVNRQIRLNQSMITHQEETSSSGEKKATVSPIPWVEWLRGFHF